MLMQILLSALVGLLIALPPMVPDAVQRKIAELNNLKGGQDAVRQKARELLKDREAAKKLVEEAGERAKLDSKQFKYNAAYVLALVAFELERYDVALRFFGICEKQAWALKSRAKIAEAFDGQFSVLARQKKWADASELARSLIEKLESDDIEDDIRILKPAVAEQWIIALARQGQVKQALRLVDQLMEDYSPKAFFLELRGKVLQEAGQTEDAIKALLDAIEEMEGAERVNDSVKETFINRMRYLLSNLYVEVSQVEKAAEQLKTLLEKFPDNPGFNNDLGYIWADHDMNLDEAEKLIRKAIELERKNRDELRKRGDLLPEYDHDNAAYLDSLGWVLFKKKQYAEAKVPLLEAVKLKEGENIEILDHLADVHMALGEKAEAIAVWKRALELDATSRRDLRRREEIIKKLKAAEGQQPEKSSDKPQ
ncbi:MAG: tetratricopeptide repeat protein [Gemmataceae bacterium]|nr:tetratricopeptide repeat protein [Gemmataceae bacterium]